jgi:hypothetical protein
LETRAYLVEFEAAKLLVDKSDWDKLKQSYELTAFSELNRFFKEIMKNVFNFFSINQSKMFYLAEYFGQEMEKTINYANSLADEDIASNTTFEKSVLGVANMQLAPSLGVVAVGPLEIEILKSLFPLSEPTVNDFLGVGFWGKRDLRPEDVSIPLKVLRESQEELKVEGGRILYNTMEEGGVSYSAGDVYFRVTTEGTPEIGLEWANDEGDLVALMARFRLWKMQRDKILEDMS